MGVNDCDWNVHKGAWLDVVLANANLGRFARGLCRQPEFGPDFRHRWRVDGAHSSGKLAAIFRPDRARNFRNISDYDLHDRFILRVAFGGELDGVQQEDLSTNVATANGDHAAVPLADAFAAD